MQLGKNNKMLNRLAKSAEKIPLLLGLIICFLSAIALVYNHYITQFPGNNYFPSEAILIAAVLFLILSGSCLLFDKDNQYREIAQELVYFFLVLSVIALASNAVQFTPFSPIDKQLIVMDAVLGVHLEKIIAWTSTQSWFKKILTLSYDSLPYQMAYLPLALIFARKFTYLREYYSLMLLTTLIGFVFYYFWPTVGPATAIGSSYFTSAQYATGIKFAEIHHRLSPSTIAGGLIAMPSFHMIWSLLCLYLSRCWPVLFFLLLPLNLLLLFSLVLLGWHYFIDLIGGFIILFSAHYIYRSSLDSNLGQHVTPHIIPPYLQQ